MPSNNNNNTSSETCTVSLSFSSFELEYDIANAMWLLGDVSPVENPHDRHQIQDVLEGQNGHIIIRALDKAHASLLGLLAQFIKDPIEDGMAINNTLRHKTQYDVILSLPSNFPRAALLSLNTAMHNYLVDYALWDWTGRTCPTEQPQYTQRLAADEEAINDAKNRRTSATHIRLHPF